VENSSCKIASTEESYAKCFLQRETFEPSGREGECLKELKTLLQMFEFVRFLKSNVLKQTCLSYS
jgi:hypothetical protein